MSASDYLENEILDHLLGGADYSRPATVYLALLTDEPTDADTGTTIAAIEPSGGSYARKAITNNSTNFPAAESGAKSNGTAITFAEASGDWGTISHWALCDADTAGNILLWGAFTTPKAYGSGDTASIAIGDLDITCD